MVPKVYEVIQEKITAAIKEKGKVSSALVFSMMKLTGFLRRTVGINIGKKMFKSVTSTVFGDNIFGIGTGASPCKRDTAEFFLNLGLEWSNLYATTETSVPIVATGIFDRYPNNTVGNVNAHPEIKIRIRNANCDGIGEITVKSQLMMKGYFRRDDLTFAAFDKDGYFLTGDYGFVDKKGYLHITGRVKESIVLKNGKKVSPDDVDSYYMSLIPGIRIASRGFENETEKCDEIHLFMETDGYTEAGIYETMDKLNCESKKAPSMYRISGIHLVDKIPKTSVGKVKRYLLTLDNLNKRPIKTQDDSPDDLKERIINVLRSHTNTPEIMPYFKLLTDLGFDSLTIFEITVEIENIIGMDISAYLNTEITVEELLEITSNTVDDKLDMIEKSESFSDINDAACYPLKKTEHDKYKFYKFIEKTDKRYTVILDGVDNIIRGEQYIFCPNHESHYDGMWVIGHLGSEYRDNICSIAADYLFSNIIYKNGIIRMGGIPTHRSGNTTTALKRAYECLKDGMNLLIHPEGTRTRTGELGEFKLGAAELSIQTGVKIIPVCINGAREIFPPDRLLPRKGKKYTLELNYGTPISPEGKNAQEITEEVKDFIVSNKRKV